MRRLIALALSAFLLVACGGGGHKAPTGARPAPHAQAASQCPIGGGTLGCALARPRTLSQLHAFVSGRYIPDVSSYQGCPNWLRARGSIVGAMVKAGEHARDPSLTCNATSLNRLRIWWAPYWFVRNFPSRGWGSCADEGRAFVAQAWPYRPPGPFVLDAEVPEAAGQVPCIAAEIKHLTGWKVVAEYTGSGTDPGGGHADLLWDARWATSFDCLWTCPVAHQFTGDGFGPGPHAIAGIGSNIDISVDLGVTRYQLAPPDPYAIYPKVRFKLAFRQQASEHNTVATWDHARCRNPVERSVCKTTRFHLVLLRDRAVFVAHHQLVRGRWVPVQARWGVFHLGERVAGMQNRLHQT